MTQEERTIALSLIDQEPTKSERFHLRKLSKVTGADICPASKNRRIFEVTSRMETGTMAQTREKLRSMVQKSAVAGTPNVTAEVNEQAQESISTPGKVDSRLGALDFKNGMPAKETLDRVYENLDFTRAFDAFVNTTQGVNMAAAHKGLLDIGVKDNEVLVFSSLMDANSLFLTANADQRSIGASDFMDVRTVPFDSCSGLIVGLRFIH